MSIYNDDELSAPSWMDNGFFETILTQYENGEKVSVLKFDMSPATMKGDHYASIMFRSKVVYKFTDGGPERNISLIIKTLPEAEGMKREMLMQSKLFETEIEMYGTMLPKFEKILAEHGDNTRFGPKLLYHTLSPNKVIVMEDLCVHGYDIVRGRYLIEEEIKMIYRKLAKMHAVSYMMAKDPATHDTIASFQEGIFSSSLVLSNPQMREGIKNFIEMLTVHDEFDEYIAKFKALENEFFESITRLYRAYKCGAVKDEIMVLNHGDFHLKNMMFKHSKKTNIEDLLLVDFQLSVYAPSTVDLMYSIFMLLSPEMRLNRRNEFLHYYFDHLVATLKMLKFDGEYPKFGNIKMSLIKHRNFAVFMLSTFLPMIHGFLSQDPEKLKDKNLDFENPDALKLMLRNLDFVQDVKKLLPSFLNDGYLD